MTSYGDWGVASYIIEDFSHVFRSLGIILVFAFLAILLPPVGIDF